MISLFDKNRHVSLYNTNWDPIRAKNFIVEIFNSTESEFLSKQHWPAHPNDIGKEDKSSLLDLYMRESSDLWRLNQLAHSETIEKDDNNSLMDLYMGASGVIWGLKQLEEKSYGIIKNDYHDKLDFAKSHHKKVMNSFLKKANFNNNEEYQSGLLMGDLGFIVTKLKYSKSSSLIESFISILQNNIENSVCEYMWGSSGALSALLAYSNVIEPQIFIRLVNKTLDALERQLIESPTFGCKIWPQNLYGSQVCDLGAVHGFAANAFSIIKSYKYLDLQLQKYWTELFRKTIKITAIEENSLVNWPNSLDGSNEEQPLVQFCHGAPGIICCFSDLIDGSDPEFDSLMYKAGNLVYTAGPLKKGANLCHGTSGNGFAFLKLFHKTGDQLWLDRAREFAMYAIDQSIQKWKHYNQRHYSLWTGDIGLAIYLDACIKGSSEIPTFDTF